MSTLKLVRSTSLLSVLIITTYELLIRSASALRFLIIFYFVLLLLRFPLPLGRFLEGSNSSSVAASSKGGTLANNSTIKGSESFKIEGTD